ncbi:MAG: RdgB/HAM1 family non-canonical purine NTP pyrophosphatase [Candidatus Cloacimonadota bacterium]|nr:RdgB/HAM1 family non-canonical purine NTP pyrophosphatase [Candidatus Cloacimonadota bacterium]
MTMKLVLATHNDDKIFEIKSLLQDLPIEILSYKNFKEFPDVVEDRDTLKGNAEKKAKEIWERHKLPTIADDTGLFVKILNGAPGVYSSRYAGENVTYEDNRNKLLRDMQDVPSNKRDALFRTIIAFVDFDGKVEFLSGECKGFIGFEEKGKFGFGYDPIFYLKDSGKSFAELTFQEKNIISHRGKALQKFKDFLNAKIR